MGGKKAQAKELLDKALQVEELLDKALQALDKALEAKELLDKTLDELIEQAGNFLNKRQKSNLDKAYQSGDYWKAIDILYKRLQPHLKQKTQSQESSRKLSKTEVPLTQGNSAVERKEGKADMDIVNNGNVIASGNPSLFLILTVLALAVLAFIFVYLKKSDKVPPSHSDATVGEITQRNTTHTAATEQEKDFLELIRLLAVASHKTDEYLKS